MHHALDVSYTPSPGLRRIRVGGLASHVMHSHLLWMHAFFSLNIHCEILNALLKHLKRSSWLIIHLSSLCLNTKAKQLVVNVKDSKASKPLKSEALLYSTNISTCWIPSSIGGSSSIHIISITFWMAPSLISYSRPNACLLGTFNLLNFAMISHRWALVKRVASSFIRILLRFIESKGLENDMSKVHTYQLSAHQQLRFKVRT